MYDVKKYIVIGVLLLMLVAALIAWYFPSNKESTTGLMAPPPIAGKVLPTVTIPAPTGVKVIPKGKVKKVVKLPPNVENDDTIEVTATANLAPSEAGSEVVTTFDTKTGDTTILARQKDLPLFAFENKRRIAVGYGLGTQGTIAMIQGEWTFLRVGSFHIGTQAEITTTTGKAPEARVMGLVDYRW